MISPRTIISGGDVGRHYDELDGFYMDVWGEHVHHGLWINGRERITTAVRQLVDVVAAAAELAPDDAVCDIGSGYGAAARHIVRDYGARITAITVSPRQHKYALERSAPSDNPVYVLGDWLENRLPSAEFDAAYAIECASHMPDPAQFLDEVARVLKPGGRFVMCAWVASEHANDRQIRYLLEPICREGRLAHLSTSHEYLQRLESAGLSVVQFRDLSRNVRQTWTHVIRRTVLRLASRPAYLRFLLRSGSDQRMFLVTIFRLWLAYRVGALRYCMFKCRKPGPNRSKSANLA